MKVTVQHNQNIFDVAVQHLGDAYAAFDIAVLNGISISKELVPGTILSVPVVIADNKKMVEYLKINKKIPASSSEYTTSLLLQEGIGYWTIGQDFIVL
ncbi:MAG: hypothetical protein EAZ35_02165 [Sphingobacteriia bacterium]|nr:MAG: hypothetical protein EAZ35_02165 [Sphingobacteriia bacterium]